MENVLTEDLKLKIIKLLFSINDARILKDALSLLETEMNVQNSNSDALNSKAFHLETADEVSLLSIQDFCTYIKDCEKSEDMTEQEFFSDLKNW